MSADLIIWKEAVTTNDLKEVGKFYEVFAGKQVLFSAKNPDKRAVFLVKDVTPEGKEVRAMVITTAIVNRLFREGKLTRAQLLGLVVLRNDNFVTKDNVKADEPIFMLSLPATGWKEMGAVEEITNLEDLALL